MHLTHSHRLLPPRSVAVILGCALIVLGATSALAIDETAVIELTIDEIRIFERQAYGLDPRVSDDARLILSAAEINFLEQNLFLPTGSTTGGTTTTTEPLLPPEDDGASPWHDGGSAY